MKKCSSCDNKISSSVSDELCDDCWNKEMDELLDVLEIDWELPGIVSEDWEEIKKQYKKLIAVNDPNQFESNDQEKRDAENRIKEINEAFEELWNMLSKFEEIDLGQDIARSWAYLASILHNRYEFDTALTFIENAIELEPNNDEWKNAKNVISTSLEIKKMAPSISKLTDNLENITSIMENADEKTRKSAEDILKPFLNSGFNFSEKEQDTNSNDTSSEDFYEKEENTNHYEIMGLERHASQKEIQKRFRELSLKFHPDKEPSLLSQQAMKRIIEAYEILKDPKKREEYDKTLA